MLSKKISKLNNAVYIFHVFSYVWVLGFRHVSHRVFTLFIYIHVASVQIQGAN